MTVTVMVHAVVMVHVCAIQDTKDWHVNVRTSHVLMIVTVVVCVNAVNASVTSQLYSVETGVSVI